MIAFGTLRIIPEDQGNSKKMFIKTPILHKKCLIPHMVPQSIWLNFEENSYGLAEIFYYNEQDWIQIIKELDILEDFDPKSSNNYSYQRTLIKAYLVDDDFENEKYNKGLNLKKRSVKIKNLYNYECVYGWIYSNEKTNKKCEKLGDQSPIIYY